jgi:predicted kinase
MVPSKLHFLSGKMAAGKSTFARDLARAHEAALLVEDDFLARLYPGEIHGISDYVKYSGRIKEALSEHIVSLLRSGVTVVLDFPGNTPNQRNWFRSLFECAGVTHELHFLDVPDSLCKLGLKERSKELPPGSPFTTEAEFEAITNFFNPLNPKRDSMSPFIRVPNP